MIYKPCLFAAIKPYTDIANAPVIIGVCSDMCPEKERYMREYQANLSVYEMVSGTQDGRVGIEFLWIGYIFMNR